VNIELRKMRLESHVES